MAFIYCKGKIQTLFFLPTICKIERKEGGHAIVLAWLHSFVGFRKLNSYETNKIQG